MRIANYPDNPVILSKKEANVFRDRKCKVTGINDRVRERNKSWQ